MFDEAGNVVFFMNKGYDMSRLIDKTTFKFLIVGVINTLVGTSVMFLAYNLFGLGYWISSAANYIIGSMVSYFLNKYFTFQNKEKSARQIVKFVFNISVCYLIAYGVAKPFVHMLLDDFSVTMRDNGAMLVGMCLFVGLNYLGQRFFVFRDK